MVYFLFWQSENIHGKINHQEINTLARQLKGKLADPILRNLRGLKSKISTILNGEENYRVCIYISDELDEPIEFISGPAENELVIDIEEDGVEYTWSKKTWWKFAADFFKDSATAIMHFICYLWKSGLAILGNPTNEIDFQN